ncbi:MAG: hypothetical protein JXA60_04260 [Candidatus Coatesbacteria bacterium]|nr:hypothetical protein [Candidatus Coatesbacteria bacterium]
MLTDLISYEKIKEFKAAHKILSEMSYNRVKITKGYANKTLKVDLSTNTIENKPVNQMMKDKFIGGKGFDLYLMWQEVNGNTKWNDPENTICIASGPLGGTTSYPGSGKSIATSISPLTQSVVDCNVGGFFGPFLKCSGWDAIALTGKASEDVIIFIDGENCKVTIETAPFEEINAHILSEQLTRMYARNEIDQRNISVVSAGRAAENTFFGVLNFSWYDFRRETSRIKQAGRGGIGTVFRDKKIKAVVAKCPYWRPKWSITLND